MISRQVRNTQTGVLSARGAGKLAMERRILETTDRLFYQQGIRAVGVDTIAAEIGISKRTLYNYFPSKDALIVAYLSRRSRPIGTSDAPAADQVFAVFDGLERVVGSDEFRGCPFVNAVAELGHPRHPARAVAIAFKEQRRMRFREMVTRPGVRDAGARATQVALLLDGAIAAALTP